MLLCLKASTQQDLLGIWCGMGAHRNDFLPIMWLIDTNPAVQ